MLSRLFPIVYLVVVIGQAKRVLNDTWSTTVPQNEHGFCVQHYHRFHQSRDTVVYMIDSVTPALASDAGPTQVTLDCSRLDSISLGGQPHYTDLPDIHTHPPQIFDKSTQTWLYTDGFMFPCEPSSKGNSNSSQYNDVDDAKTLGSEFSVVQCDTNQFTIYGVKPQNRR